MHTAKTPAIKTEENNPEYSTHTSSTQPCQLNDTLCLSVGSKNLTRLRAIRFTYVPALPSATTLDANLDSPRKVDTKANPLRSIWTHPYEDEEYLKAHPDVRSKINTGGFGGSESDLQPPSFEESQRLHSFGGASSSNRPQATYVFAANSRKRKDRGFLGKLKDNVIGTKEEREAERRREQEEVIRYVIGQLRPETDLLHSIVFAWKRSNSAPGR